MIKINKSDTLIDIVNKISDSSEADIVLDFPFGHQILHSFLSLKIIKNKCLGKELIIITNDIKARRIGKKIGIKYSIINNGSTTNKQNILKYNFTSLSYLKYQLKKYKEEIIILFTKNKDNEQLKIDNILIESKSRIGFFIIILFSSISILIFIFYFAVSKTTITIVPETTIKLRSKNIIFTEKKNIPSYVKNTVQIKKISNTISIKETFGSSGVKRKNNSLSTGKVIIYNLLKETVELIKNTRLKTSEGILYIIKSNAYINKASMGKNGKIIPGKVEVEIEAKNIDIYGQIIGSNGNISKGVKLTLPGLSKNKEKGKIYAITSSDIKGGNDNFTKILTQNDIKKGYTLLKSKLKQKAIKKLKERIKKNNISNNITYEVLGVYNISKYTNLKIVDIGHFSPGDKIKNFSLSGTITINTYIYNKNSVINKMRATINNSIIEGYEKIIYINKNSLRISNVLYKQERPEEIKATVEIEVFLSHNFDNKENFYIEKLKNKILGLKKEEALKILLNDNKISEVNINIRPFFINRISNIFNNIEFKLNK